MLEEAQETTQVTNTRRSDKDIRENTNYIHTQGLINKQDTGEHRKKDGSYTEGGTEKQHTTHETKLQSKTGNHLITN